ncbi:hypothetical protein GCM10027300_21490 [Modestobacter lapidis]
MAGLTYKGVPLEELRIDAVEWSAEAAQHIRTRSSRQPGDLDLEPEWVTEAALSQDRMVRLAMTGSEETASLKVVGTSAAVPGGPRLLKVWLWSDDPRDATWQVGSAALANSSDQRRHGERNRNEPTGR